jgi:uncharacterized protein (TIGR02145 family)
MAENLNFNANGSVCYNNQDSNCAIYGRLYDWATAMTACPEGWHLPSDAEWDVLVNSVGGSSTAGKHLKAMNGWNDNGNGLDTYSFAALPGGYQFFANGGFDLVGTTGVWWSARSGAPDEAYSRNMSNRNENVAWNSNTEKGSLLSARCIQAMGGPL